MQNQKQEQLIRANNVQLHMNYSLESGAIFVLGTCMLHTNNDLFRTPNKCFNIPSYNIESNRELKLKTSKLINSKNTI